MKSRQDYTQHYCVDSVGHRCRYLLVDVVCRTEVAIQTRRDFCFHHDNSFRKSVKNVLCMCDYVRHFFNIGHQSRLTKPAFITSQ